MSCRQQIKKRLKVLYKQEKLQKEQSLAQGAKSTPSIEPPVLLQKGDVFAHYVIERLIVEGRMSESYRVVESAAQNRFVLKLFVL